MIRVRRVDQIKIVDYRKTITAKDCKIDLETAIVKWRIQKIHYPNDFYRIIYDDHVITYMGTRYYCRSIGTR